MADRVRYNLDRMALTFRQMETTGLFTKDEIKAIVQRRTDYEYVLRRFELSIDEAEQYVTYEKNLDKLLEIRTQKLFLKVSEEKELKGQMRALKTAQIRHVAFVYDRIVRRFPNELRIWDDYIEFLVSKNSNALLDALFGKVLALHPREVHYWIKAANHELFQNNNMHAARVLMQRALRFNDRNIALWRASFELEIHNILRSLQRKRALGLSADEFVDTIIAPAMVVFRFARDSLGVDHVAVLIGMHVTTILSLPVENNHLAEQIEQDLKDHFANNLLVLKHTFCVHLRAALVSLVSESNESFSFSHIIAQFTTSGFTEIDSLMDTIIEEPIAVKTAAVFSLVETFVAAVSKLYEIEAAHTKSFKKRILSFGDGLLDYGSDGVNNKHSVTDIEGIAEIWKTTEGKALKKTIVNCVIALIAKLSSQNSDSNGDCAERNQHLRIQFKLFAMLESLQLGDKSLSQTIKGSIESIATNVVTEASALCRKRSPFTTAITFAEKEAFTNEVQTWAELFLTCMSDSFTTEQQQSVKPSIEILAPWLIQGRCGDKLLRTVTVENEAVFMNCMLNILKDIIIVNAAQRAEYLVILLSSTTLSEEDRIMITDAEILRSKYRKFQDAFTSIVGLKKKYPISFSVVDMSPFFLLAIEAVDSFFELLGVRLESKSFKAEVNFYQQVLEFAMRDCENVKEFYDKYVELLRKLGKHKEANHVQFKRRRLVDN